MISAHIAAGLAVIGLNALAGLVGGVAWLRDRPSVRFWPLLRVAQLAVVVQAAIGGLLALEGRVADDWLHYLYGLLPLAVSMVAEGARAGAAQQELGGRDVHALEPEHQRRLALAILRRETGIMAVSCLVILFLALRAAGTAGLVGWI